MTAVVALGDSLTCGEGVGVRVRPDRTCPALLAAALPGGAVRSLAMPGARTADVRAHQVPHVGRPDLATLLVGLNDVTRAGFDATAVRRDLHAAVAALRRAAGTLLLGRLHDPTLVLPLPASVRLAAQRRISAVNAAVDAVAGRSGVLVLDVAALAPLREPAAWAVDRVHPSEAGHAVLASGAAEVLRAAGWDLPVPEAVPLPPAPTVAERSRWAVRHGGPYLARHVRELGPPALAGLVRRG